MSSTRCTGFDANELIKPFAVGTIARFDVTTPSLAFNVETRGRAVPCGQSVRKLKGPGGTTVAFKTKDWAVAGAPQPLNITLTSIVPVNGGKPGVFLVSNTRQGVKA